MKRIHIILDKELLAELCKRSEVTGAPVSEIIRRAIRAFLKSKK